MLFTEWVQHRSSTTAIRGCRSGRQGAGQGCRCRAARRRVGDADPVERGRFPPSRPGPSPMRQITPRLRPRLHRPLARRIMRYAVDQSRRWMERAMARGSTSGSMARSSAACWSSPLSGHRGAADRLQGFRLRRAGAVRSGRPWPRRPSSLDRVRPRLAAGVCPTDDPDPDDRPRRRDGPRRRNTRPELLLRRRRFLRGGRRPRFGEPTFYPGSGLERARAPAARPADGTVVDVGDPGLAGRAAAVLAETVGLEGVTRSAQIA